MCISFILICFFGATLHKHVVYTLVAQQTSSKMILKQRRCDEHNHLSCENKGPPQFGIHWCEQSKTPAMSFVTKQRMQRSPNHHGIQKLQRYSNGMKSQRGFSCNKTLRCSRKATPVLGIRDMLTLRDFENLQIESLRPPGKTTAKAGGSGSQNERQFANDRKESTNVQQRAYITLVYRRAIRKTNKG